MYIYGVWFYHHSTPFKLGVDKSRIRAQISALHMLRLGGEQLPIINTKTKIKVSYQQSTYKDNKERNKMKTTNKTIKEILKNGGGTLNKGKLINYEYGYMVGQGTINIIDTNTLKGENNILTMVKTILERQDNNLIGLWVNEGLIYIDNVKLVEDKKLALKLANDYKELAIWDNANKNEISTMKEGK